MNIEDISWHDSEIKSIQIKYEELKMEVFNDVMQKNLIIKCIGFIGLTDLWFIEEDTEIYDIIISNSVINQEKYQDLAITTNGKVCHIYCKDIKVDKK